MTTLYLIRHAESRMNAEFPHLIGGRSNHSPLTPAGEAQARILGKRLQREDVAIDQWFTSPAIRTIETARIVRGVVGGASETIRDDDLQEVFQGDWEGLVRADTYTAEILQQMQDQKNYFKAPNGESQFDVETRMAAFAARCHASYPDGKVVAFTHGVAIKCLLRFVQDWNPLNTYHTDMHNTGISMIYFNVAQGKWRLATHNDHGHLLNSLNYSCGHGVI